MCPEVGGGMYNPAQGHIKTKTKQKECETIRSTIQVIICELTIFAWDSFQHTLLIPMIPSVKLSKNSPLCSCNKALIIQAKEDQ